MPDISKCDGGECPLKERCYRFTAKPSEFRQAYFTTPPWNPKAKTDKGQELCTHFWPNEIEKKERAEKRKVSK